MTHFFDDNYADMFDSVDDPSRFAEAFQEAFNKIDEKEHCEHKKVETWVDGKGYCISCGLNFTNAAERSTECQHENVGKNDAGVSICTLCGVELDILDFQQEWRWYGSSDNRTSRDPSRCHFARSAPKGVKSLFESKNYAIPQMLIDLVDSKYKKILEVEGNKVIRGQGRESIIVACLFHAYQEIGEYRPAAYLGKIFGLKQASMSAGMTKYYSAFPEARTKSITPEKLLPWIMKITGIERTHYRRISCLAKYISHSSSLIERSNPQSVAAAIVFFYLCINSEYKSKLGITKASFSAKAGLSDITVTKLVREIADISRTSITM